MLKGYEDHGGPVRHDKPGVVLKGFDIENIMKVTFTFLHPGG